ncbi:MAG: D-alanyl-D-alanine carboxypeptidase/D-alanyl-D-alanine-endopeptidase [Nitriliruptor sp.]|nr:MAG: D-alanyl-D-alanine carboxypeptidase/D-alanyl-D-alanine-endopeptidase [Nitriliruptor sp.]
MRPTDAGGGRTGVVAGAGNRLLGAVVALVVLVAACSGGGTPVEPEATDDGPPPIAPVEDVDEPDDDADGGSDEPSQADSDVEVAPDPPVEFPPPPDGRDELTARTQELVDTAVVAADDATLGVMIIDEHGRTIAAHRADESLLPASTMKVVTAAAILTTLGPDGRLRTSVDATAPIDADGVLRGDLHLLGGGDPALVTDEYTRWVYPARPATPLAALADDLVAAGLRQVDGEVIGLAPGFTGPTRAEGWPDRYFSSFDARYASGLTVDAGLRTILTYPEPEPDDEDADDADDADDAASDDEDADDAATDGEDADDEADGDDPEDGSEDEPEDLGPPTVTVDHVQDPAAHAAAELVRLLEEREVEVTGASRSGEVSAPPVGRLATVQSPPMDELLRFTVERSDNHFADGMFQTIGRVRTGEGSWIRGDRALRQMLDRFQIDHDGAVFADGSGLSRDDRLSPRLLVDLDRTMTDGPAAETWVSLMAVMGETGTLRQRLRGTVAQGRFRGKTGTLRDVTALSGAVIGDDGTRYHLAVLANEADGPGRWVARELMDELALQLSAEVAGCDVVVIRTEPPDNGGPPPLPRSAITC